MRLVVSNRQLVLHRQHFFGWSYCNHSINEAAIRLRNPTTLSVERELSSPMLVITADSLTGSDSRDIIFGQSPSCNAIPCNRNYCIVEVETEIVEAILLTMLR